MIIYSVTIALQPEIEPDWVDWMKRVHIPDVLATGCFRECRMHRAVEPIGEQRVYVMQYHCRSIDDYERYRADFAPALQQQHTDRFAGRFCGSRQLLEELARVESPRKA